ncbi:TonB-dependent receptor [uncultured Sunxiuqinia sp.]|uniref:SusC/RagA family TonB-linked outer membrane protein n=1 Tax=uncultured Sunxiuqinia sp. TaxID=1573825 RepID=UPI002AA82CFF|nr:TonB-dependent receptor [uncultured Sunxiuqinia sp.]
MIYKYNRRIFLFIVITLCLNATLKAQIDPQDSIAVSEKPVINIAYDSQPEWMVTGAVSSVKGEELQNTFSTSFPFKLAGRIPGLTAQQLATEPGFESSALYSRGVNTFGVGKNDMLILVDGFESNFSELTSEEVESVTLLKDAAATAMYGSRAANGVLLVTTKRGKVGKLKVEFSTQQGVQMASRLPQYLDSYDHARLYNEALVNDGKPELYTNEDLQLYQKGTDPYFHPNVNWYDEVLTSSSPISNYNLNFTGGSKAVQYFVLLNQVKSNNLYLRTGDESEFSENGKYQRINFRMNVDIQLTKRFSTEISVGGTVVDQANPGGHDSRDVFNSMAVIPPNEFAVRNPNGTLGRNALYSNPMGDILNQGFYTSNGRTLNSTIGFTEELDFITKGLSFTPKISFNSYFLSQSNKTRSYQSFEISKDDQGEIVYTKFGIDESLEASEGASDQNRSYVIQSFLNYDRNFGANDISAVLMYNSDNFTISGNSQPIKHENVSGRVTFANNKKYIGEISFSYMGSGNFPKGSRFGFFPAVSAGWIASNEDFMKDNKSVNYLKFRTSYGMVGNDLIGGPAFMFDQTYPGTNPYYFGTSNTSAGTRIQGRLANPNVTWEKEKNFNIGLEAKLFDKVDISLDVFNRDRYDILVQPNTVDPDFMGYTKPYLNEGKTNNKGFETMLRYSNDKKNEFRFFIETNAWYFKNKVVFNSEALQLYDYLYRTGQPINQPFGYEAIGFFKDQNDIDASPKQNWVEVQPGDVKYKDLNDDGKINELDIHAVGKTGLPNFSAGLRIGAEYKGFDFDVFFQGVSSRSVTFSGLNFEAFQNNGKAGTIALNRWTQETAETATYPRLSSENNDNNFRYSSLWIRDGSFIKLRSIELGYTLPAKISTLAKLDKTRIFINGNNLFSSDHMDGYRDPEVGSYYPAMKSFSAGIRVQFK